jgi:hypothetical protein
MVMLLAPPDALVKKSTKLVVEELVKVNPEMVTSEGPPLMAIIVEAAEAVATVPPSMVMWLLLIVMNGTDTVAPVKSRVKLPLPVPVPDVFGFTVEVIVPVKVTVSPPVGKEQEL